MWAEISKMWTEFLRKRKILLAHHLCTIAPHILLPTLRFPHSACYNFIDGTNQRVAIDSQCSDQQRRQYLDGFGDAQRLASNALKHPTDGIDAMDTYMGRGGEMNSSFRDFWDGAFGRISMNLPLPISPRFIALDCAEHWHRIDFCINHPSAIAYATPVKGISGVVTAERKVIFNETVIVDIVRGCGYFFDKVAPIDDTIRASIHLPDPPELDRLATAGSVMLHELMHTNMMTDNQRTIDTSYQGMKMYGANMCSVVARRGPERGGGIPLSSQNADSWTLAASAMFWKNVFAGKMAMPGVALADDVMRQPQPTTVEAVIKFWRAIFPGFNVTQKDTTPVENGVRHPELPQIVGDKAEITVHLASPDGDGLSDMAPLHEDLLPEPPEVPEPDMAKIKGLQIVYTIPDLVASQVGVYLLGKAMYYAPQVYSRFVIPMIPS